jgi:hypothetical protein
MSAEVLFPDGTQQGWHTWNVFGGTDGFQVDLTVEQFRAGEQIQEAKRITRTPGRLPNRTPERYQLLRARVLAQLERNGS